ncbi:MAG: hypothetical protein V4509_00590 [Patescibacteria group bacterium]
MKKLTVKQNNKLAHDIAVVQAMIAGHCIGVSFNAKVNGTSYHYDHGNELRKVVDHDIRKIFNYAYNLGKKSNEKIN